MRRGARVALSLVGLFTGAGRRGPAAAGAGLLLRRVLPLVLAVFAGRGAARTFDRVRHGVEAGALGLMAFQVVRRLLQRRRRSARNAQ